MEEMEVNSSELDQAEALSEMDEVWENQIEQDLGNLQDEMKEACQNEGGEAEDAFNAALEDGPDAILAYFEAAATEWLGELE